MTRLAAIFSIALLALPAAAEAAKRPLPSRSQAAAALERVEALKAGRGVETGRELSPALNQLAAALPSLSGSDRLAAERLLARPTDGASDPQEDGYADMAVLDIWETDHFVVHYVKSAGGDQATMAQASEIAGILEQAYATETAGLGWREPPADTDAQTEASGNPNGKVDVYLKNVLDRGIFGYVAIDTGQTSVSSVPHWSYMVLDNGYTEVADAVRVGVIQATVAHELNHVLQNGYDFLQDTWMFESTAVWMEEMVFPTVDDYLRYIQDWVNLTHVAMAAFRLDPATGDPDGNSIKAYGSGAWNHWLSGRYGPDTIREAWARSPDTGDFAPAAYNAELAARGVGSFTEEFERFAAATAEWRAPGTGFPDLYPEVARTAAVPADGSSVELSMDHTTFRHLDVPPASLGAPLIQVSATFPAGISGAVALVGRTGGDTDGAVTTQLARAPAGGLARARLDNPAQFARVTAVVVNSDATQLGFDSTVNDWIFRDPQAVPVSVDSARAPSGVTADVSDLADKAVTLNADLAANVLDTTWRFEYGETDAYGKTAAGLPQPLQNGNVAARVSARVEKLRPSTVYHYRVVAENAFGRLVGEDRIFITAEDVTKPVFTVAAPRSARRSRAITSRVKCDERCTVSAILTLDRRTARRNRVRRTLARGRAVAPENTRRRLVVRIPRRTVRKLARAKTLRATITFTAADDSGNKTKVVRRIRLRR